jgi:flagellar protein FliS
MTGNAAYLESRILSADPVELIAILYEQAILSVREARESLAKKDIAGRTRNISRAIAIVNELDCSLDHSAGGKMSANLTRLYQYIRERLTTANIRKEDRPLAEVESLLNTLAQSWSSVKGVTAQASSVSAPAAPEPEMPKFSTPFFLETEFAQSSHSWTA